MEYDYVIYRDTSMRLRDKSMRSTWECWVFVMSYKRMTNLYDFKWDLEVYLNEKHAVLYYKVKLNLAC